MPCEYCRDLDEMNQEFPDGATHGAQMICDECEAEYGEEYSGKMWAINPEAKKNHPELEALYKEKV